MNAELQALKKRTDLGEEDFQAILVERELCLGQGDELGYAHCLLVLAHAVLWVRSDNEEFPFDRARTLALEALAIMRRHGDKGGELSALLQAVPGHGPKEASEMLASAMVLAKALGDDRALARVLNRQAAHLGMSDKKRAASLNREALEIYERLGDARGQAVCLFGLTIQEQDADLKRGYALRSADLYRSIGNHNEAAKSMSLALMYWPKGKELEAERACAAQGLADAQASASRSLEGSFYAHLSRICAQQGEFEQAEQYRRWEKDIEDSDGLTPEERKRDEIEFTKFVVDAAKKMGNEKASKLFQSRLKDLKKSQGP